LGRESVSTMENTDFETPRGSIPHQPTADAVFVRRILLAAMVVGVLLVLWQVSLVLILTFGGIVVAVALRNIAAPLGRWLRVPDQIALLITVLDVSFIALGFFYFFGAMANHQFASLADRLPQTLLAAKGWLNETLLGRQILGAVQSGGDPAERLMTALPWAGGILGGLGEADGGAFGQAHEIDMDGAIGDRIALDFARDHAGDFGAVLEAE